MDNTENAQSSTPSIRFVRIFVIACLGIAGILVGLNHSVDRYYVFHPQDGEFFETLEPNTRFLKAEYLLKHCREFNAAILGSSRDVGYLTPDFDRIFEVKSYNYGVAAGNLRGVLARLEWLASMDCFPARVFLPISIDRLRLPQRPDDLLRKEHPSIIGTPQYRREFVLSYIGTDAFISNLRKLAQRIRGRDDPKFRYEMSTGDVFYLWDRSFEIERCAVTTDRADFTVIRQFADFLVEIRSLVEVNGSALTLIWNPQPLDTQLPHFEETQTLFDLLGPEFETIYRLPFSDERLIDSAYFHDRGHFKHELGTAVVVDPANRVSLDQLLSEMRDAAQSCSRSQ